MAKNKLNLRKGLTETSIIFGICLGASVVMTIAVLLLAILIGFIFKLNFLTAWFVSPIVALVIILIWGVISFSKD